MTIPNNTPRGSYGPKADMPPAIPWLGVAAAPPAIPKLYWDAYSDEQRIKALWACFNGLADRVNQLGYYYLPDFQGKWDRTKEYPPLSVVEAPEGIEDITAGDSYTALDWVPVGTPLTDTTYWAKTGNYNAQVAEVQQLIESITPLDDSPKEGSQKAISSAGVYNAIESTKNEITLTMSKGVLLSGLNLLCTGDSFGAASMIPQGYGAWAESIKKMASFNNVYNYCRQSSGYLMTQEYPYIELAKEAAQAVDTSSINYIVVQGGLNDVATSNQPTDGYTHRQDIADTFQYLRETFPNATILAVPMTWSGTWNGREPYRPEFAKWAEGIIDEGIKKGCQIAERPWWWQFGLDGVIGGDNFHPTPLGGDNIAAHILANIQGHDSKIIEHTEGNVGASQYIVWRMSGGTMTMTGCMAGATLDSNKQVKQPVPDFLIPYIASPLSRLFNSALADTKCQAGYINSPINPGTDNRPYMLFYGGDFISMNQGQQAGIYFTDTYTV